MLWVLSSLIFTSLNTLSHFFSVLNIFPSIMADGLYFNAIEYIMVVTVQKMQTLLQVLPLPSSKDSYLQNEADCKTLLVKMSFICSRIKNHFHVIGLAFSLALKQWLGATRKWPKDD